MERLFDIHNRINLKRLICLGTFTVEGSIVKCYLTRVLLVDECVRKHAFVKEADFIVFLLTFATEYFPGPFFFSEVARNFL